MVDITREGDFRLEGECLSICEEIRNSCVHNAAGEAIAGTCDRNFRDCTEHCERSVTIHPT